MSASSKSSRGRQATLGGTVAAIALAIFLRSMGLPEGEIENATNAVSAKTSTPAAPALDGSSALGADARIEDAVRERRSGFMISLNGEVLKMLPDDNKGSRHQRFLIELATGRTLLVAHNIDLAKRVPVSRGDALRVHGQYEWNERGGVLHWTHEDPDGHHEGGWIEHRGTRYE